MAAAKETAKVIRQLLERLRTSERRLRARKISADEMEQIGDEVAEKARHLARAGILEALDLAMARRKASADVQITILWHALDQPEVVRRVGEWLQSPDADFQASALRVVSEKRLVQFAGNLNPLLESTGAACRPAIGAAGRLQSPVNLPALLKVADRQDPELELPLVYAMRNFGEAGRPYLLRVFQTVRPDEARPAPWGDRQLGSVESESMTKFIRWQHARNASDLRKKVRVLAAGGLAKLGDQGALAFLLEMLYDPDESSPSYRMYGQARSAAEALCDAFGWPIDPRSGVIERVRALASDRFGR